MNRINFQKTILAIAFPVVLYSCQTGHEQGNPERIMHPSHKYTFVNVTSDKMGYLETDYLPVYSDIYHMDGTRRFLLTSTISIRNTSLSDSAYVFKANYHDSYGTLLRNYIDKPILIKPLESIEFVVENKEDKGGAGANFIIEWGGKSYSDQLLIQAIMTGTSNQQGLSFTTDAKIIKRSGIQTGSGKEK